MAPARPRSGYPQLSWWGWGDPAQVPVLPERVRTLLADGLGVQAPGRRPGALAEMTLPAPRLPEPLAARLSAVVGAGYHSAEPEARVRHALGKSTPDLLQIRSGKLLWAPDLVLAPETHEQVQELLELATEARVAVVPFGGGTSVVGGLAPQAERFAGTVAVDLRRMNAMIALDEESRLAVLEPGLRGPQAEELLGARGYTIGHFPQSFQYATLGGFAAARSSGQASAGYGRFDALVLGLRVASPAGSLELGRAPQSAAGPDLRQLFLGSEGALGVITALTVQVRPVPERRCYDGWRFRSFAEGARALRALAQDGPMPTVARLSDETETAVTLAAPAELGRPASAGGCLAVLGFEGAASDVAHRRGLADTLLAKMAGERAPEAGAAWAEDRYRGPYLRDALLDAGALVETLETVAFWSALPRLYSEVSEALRGALGAQGTPAAILCHISHVYPAGASLYFTVACAALDDPFTQWRAAKAAAGDAIIAAGGSISHHHGVGRDHLPWYGREIGGLGLAALRAVKRRLDPAGILNPGILITEESP